MTGETDPWWPSAADLVAAQLRAERETKGPRAVTDGLRYRASNASQCARKIGYEAAGVPADLTLEDSTLAVFAQGDDWHHLVQRALLGRLAEDWLVGVEAEATTGLVGCHADAVLTERPPGYRTIVVEIKSMARFAWQIAAGERPSPSGEPDGPKVEHLTQAGIYAAAFNASHVWIVYCCKDDGRMIDWMLPVGQPVGLLESPADLAAAELARVERIEALRLDGKLPPRV